jgi:signal transduction histidine kinase
VRKHAPGSRSVMVELRWSPDEALVRIANATDGPPPQSGSGFGLSGLAERAQALGGTFDAEVDSDGFETRPVLPLTQAEMPA